MANTSYEQLLFNAIKNGQSGKSVYDIWLELGNTGTPQDFLDSLKMPSIIATTTILTTSWILTDGIYKVIISDENVTANSVVNVNFDVSSIKAILSSNSNGNIGYVNPIDGGFEIYSNFLPTTDLSIRYSIINE